MQRKIISMCVCLFLVFLLTGCRLQKHYEYKENEYKTNNYKDYDKIEINDDFAPIQIESTKDKELQVLYYEAENDSEYYRIQSIKNNILEINRIDEENGLGIFIFGESTNKEVASLNIKIPEDWNGTLEIKGEDNDIKIKNFQTKELKINNYDSMVILENVVIDNELFIKNRDDDIILNNVKVGENINIMNRDGNILGNFIKTNNIYYGSKYVNIKVKDGNIEISYD